MQVKEPAELEGEVIHDEHFFCLSLKVVSSPVANSSKTSHKMNLSLPSSEGWEFTYHLSLSVCFDISLKDRDLLPSLESFSLSHHFPCFLNMLPPLSYVALKFISTSECSSLSMLSFDLYLRLLLEISDSSLRVGSDLIYLIENSLSRIDFSASDVENIFGDFFRRFSDSIISTWKQVQGSSEVVPSYRIGDTDLSCLEDPAKVLLAFSKSSCSDLNQESALSPHLFPLLPVPRFQKPYQDMVCIVFLLFRFFFKKKKNSPIIEIFRVRPFEFVVGHIFHTNVVSISLMKRGEWLRSLRFLDDNFFFVWSFLCTALIFSSLRPSFDGYS